MATSKCGWEMMYLVEGEFHRIELRMFTGTPDDLIEAAREKLAKRGV